MIKTWLGLARVAKLLKLAPGSNVSWQISWHKISWPFAKHKAFIFQSGEFSSLELLEWNLYFCASGQECSSKFASFAFLCLSNLDKSSIVPWHGPESVLGIFGLNKETARSEPSGVYFPSSPQKSFKLGILSVTKNTRQSFHRASMCLPHLIFVNCGTSPHHLTL